MKSVLTGKSKESEEKKMTIRKLSKLYYIRKLIERDNMRLAELEDRLHPSGMKTNGMPRNPSPKNMTEETIALIIDMKDKLIKERDEYAKEQAEIEEFIMSVKDYQTRLILLYRYVDLLAWHRVASKIGGNNTEDSVKKTCYRFLKEINKTDKV